MEMAGAEGGNVPKSYSLNMFKDFVPMSVFSETNQGEDYYSDLLKCLTFLFFSLRKIYINFFVNT